MNRIYVGTLSAAMRAGDILREAGYNAAIGRMVGAAEGCGYEIITDLATDRAIRLLRSRGVRPRSEPT